MKTISIIFSLITLGVLAQQDPQVLSSAGNAPTSQNGESSISFTIGEPLITTSSTTEDKIITQGFQQPLEQGRVYEEDVNAFSPNDDGENDNWQFKKQSEDYEIEIFSRWGNIVYSNKGKTSESEWNGLDQSNENVPDGTYYYTITFNGQLIENGKGYIEVTR